MQVYGELTNKNWCSSGLRSFPYIIQLCDTLDNGHLLSSRGVQISAEHNVADLEYADDCPFLLTVIANNANNANQCVNSC